MRRTVPRPRAAALAAARAVALAAVLAALLGLAAPPAAAEGKVDPTGPPFDLSPPLPHSISFTVDTSVARDELVLLTGAKGAAEALGRLKASRAFSLGVERGGGSVDDMTGRLVTAAAGTPDALAASWIPRAASFAGVLSSFETEGGPDATLLARRIASVLPPSPAVSARLRLVPLLGAGGYEEVLLDEDGSTTYLFADLPRLVRTGGIDEAPPQEAMLGVLRAAAARAWQELFAASFRKPAAWPTVPASDFDALLASSVAEGPATLFLFPDEFFPLSVVLEEPITRAFGRWNTAAELLLDGKLKDPDRSDVLANATRGEFWGRYGAIVGAAMAEAIVRSAGRDAYVKALAAGPRAVASLYVSAGKGPKGFALSKRVKKALEKAPPG